MRLVSESKKSFFGYFYQFIPEAAVYPILIFVGLEISAQSFLATPKRHYPAVVMACIPALAFLSMIFVGQIFGDATLRKATFEKVGSAATSLESSVGNPSTTVTTPVSQDQLGDA